MSKYQFIILQNGIKMTIKNETKRNKNKIKRQISLFLFQSQNNLDAKLRMWCIKYIWLTQKRNKKTKKLKKTKQNITQKVFLLLSSVSIKF